MNELKEKAEQISICTSTFNVSTTKSSDIEISNQINEKTCRSKRSPTYTGVINITQTDNNEFQWKLKINSGIVGRVAGAKFKNFAMIERNTGATIKTESIRRQLHVHVTGKSNDAVKSAGLRILIKVASVRTARPVTHFIAISLVALKDSLTKFTESVCARFSVYRSFEKSLDSEEN